MEKQKHANQHYHHRHQPIKILQAHCSHCITWWTLQCGQSARTSVSTTQSIKQRSQSGISLHGVCKWKSRQATGTIRHAAQFPATATKRKQNKAFVLRSSLKRFCWRIARRGETSAKVSGQLTMVCCSWPHCSGDAHLRYLSFIHNVAACMVHLVWLRVLCTLQSLCTKSICCHWCSDSGSILYLVHAEETVALSIHPTPIESTHHDARCKSCWC